MNQASDIMTRLKRFAIDLLTLQQQLQLPLLLLLLLPGTLKCQNIFDEPHSREFAQYLMQSHQFQLATTEWERVLFFSPGDTLARLNLLKSYRLSQKPGEAWKKLTRWYPAGSLSRPFSLEAIQLTLVQGDYPSFHSVIARSAGLTHAEKSDYELGAWLLEGKWNSRTGKARESSLAIVTDARLLDLYAKSENVHRKSPAASLALSTLVPGLGKIYSRDWKDGFVSFLFVATNAWQSYRGFSKNGINSVTGWIFGSLAIGFYSANLFGSWKSAKTYNSNQVDRIRHETEDILFTR
ncbi:MAG: hypothetical protein NTV01_04845 [Bacteroidia bacterium]|nr:hypothetical protein [Bacteroidia bacterium]